MAWRGRRELNGEKRESGEPQKVLPVQPGEGSELVERKRERGEESVDKTGMKNGNRVGWGEETKTTKQGSGSVA